MFRCYYCLMYIIKFSWLGYYSAKKNEIYECKPKDSDDIIFSLECSKNKPSKELCLAI